MPCSGSGLVNLDKRGPRQHMYMYAVSPEKYAQRSVVQSFVVDILFVNVLI